MSEWKGDMSQIEDVLSEIQAEKRDAEETVRPPADEAAIAQLQNDASGQLQVALPEGYIAFLRRSDGIDFNGTVIYGATLQDSPYLPDFQKANALFGNLDYVLYGETGDELFAQHRATGAWQIIDRASLSPLESFASFEALLEHALRNAYEH